MAHKIHLVCVSVYHQQFVSIEAGHPVTLKHVLCMQSQQSIFVEVCNQWFSDGPFTRYVKLSVVHASGMPGKFSHHRLQRKPLVSNPGMHLSTYVTHVPWCMSGLLTRGGGENVPGIPSACATRDFTYLTRGPRVDIIIGADTRLCMVGKL